MNIPVATATATASFVDPRLGFLASVAAWHDLVEHDELDVAEAFDRVVERVNDPDLFQIVVPEPEPKNAAERAWDTGWREAAVEYHQNRRRR